jgi:hypothetical protein
MASTADSLADIQPQQLRALARGRRSFWLASLVLGLGVVGAGVAAAHYGLDAWHTLPDAAQLGIRLGLALAPGLVWLALIALFARGEGALARTSLLLWLVTAVFYLVTVQPLLSRVIQVENWLFMGWWASLVADFLIIAPLQMLLLYLLLRFGVYPSPAFRRLVDGPLFGMAAGLGMAAILGWIAIWQGERFPLEQEVLQTGQRTLAYATLGAWLGFFLARARFARLHTFYLAGGFLLTVVFHTLFFALSQGAQALMPFVPRYSGLATTAALALLGGLALYWRLRKAGRAYIEAAERVEMAQAPAAPPPLLADVVRMAELQSGPTAPPPPPAPATPATEPDLEEDELASLKRSWEALIAEQEGRT